MSRPFVWQNDSFYLSAFADALQREGGPEMQRLQRFYPLVQAFVATQDLDGETAEAGCLYGLASLLFCRYERARRPDFRGSTHHVFDSFRGLSFPDREDLQTELPNRWISALQEESRLRILAWRAKVRREDTVLVQRERVGVHGVFDSV